MSHKKNFLIKEVRDASGNIMSVKLVNGLGVPYHKIEVPFWKINGTPYAEEWVEIGVHNGKKIVRIEASKYIARDIVEAIIVRVNRYYNNHKVTSKKDKIVIEISFFKHTVDAEINVIKNIIKSVEELWKNKGHTFQGHLNTIWMPLYL